MQTDVLPSASIGVRPGSVGAELESLYRATVRPVTGYFARRVSEPQLVADLTAETFAQAIGSYATFDAKRGSGQAWVFGIARRVFARHVEASRRDADRSSRLAECRELQVDEAEELVERIDAERAGQDLLGRLAELGRTERDVLELVVLAGLTPRQAADALGITAGAARVRLFRARAALRRSGASAVVTDTPGPGMLSGHTKGGQ